MDGALSDVPRVDPEHFHDCVTIIHDEMTRDSLEEAFHEAVGDWDAEIKKVPGHVPGRQAFAMLNTMRGEPLVRVVEKTTPLEADFYVHRALLEEPEEAASDEFSTRA